jgi:hypothetical protein
VEDEFFRWSKSVDKSSDQLLRDYEVQNKNSTCIENDSISGLITRSQFVLDKCDLRRNLYSSLYPG